MSVLDLELTSGKRLGVAVDTVLAVIELNDTTTTIYTAQWLDGLDVKGHVDEVMGEWWSAIGMWMVEMEDDDECEE